MTIYLAPLVCLIGVIMFFASKTNADMKKIGFAMFVIGLAVTLMTMSAGQFKLLR